MNPRGPCRPGLLTRRPELAGRLRIALGTLEGAVVSVGASRDGTCTRSKAQTEEVFARCSKGLRVSAFNARSGPVPLPFGVWVWGWVWMGTGCLGTEFRVVCRWRGVAPRDWSCARRKTRGRNSFRARREGWGDRLQCSLRPGPAAVWCLVSGVWCLVSGVGRGAVSGNKNGGPALEGRAAVMKD